MAVLMFESGAYRVEVKHLQLKDNTWYFRRRIPADIRRHYPGKNGQLFFSLKTNSKGKAAQLAHTKASEQDALWRSIRSGNDVTDVDVRKSAVAILDSFGLKAGQHVEYGRVGVEPDRFLDHLRYLSQDDDGQILSDDLPGDYRLAADMFYGKKLVPTLTQARDKHFGLGLGPKAEKALSQFHNAFQLFLEIAGDLPVDQYTRENANEFVAALIDRENAYGTIKRYVAQISHLAILYGLSGTAFDTERDPYDISGIERDVVKGVFSAATGVGKMPVKWPKSMTEKYAQHTGKKLSKAYRIKDVVTAIEARHPVVKKLKPGSMDWAQLQFEESECFMEVMLELCRHYEVATLPVHDSIVVAAKEKELATDLLGISC